jgi:hypothetical protein
VEMSNEQLKKEMKVVKAKSEIEEDRRSNAATSLGLDGKGWTNAVATRMYEEKVKALQNDLEKKVSHFII